MKPQKQKSYTLAEIVQRFGGRLVGDANVRISQIATLENAGPHHLTFLTHGKYRSMLARTRAGAVIVAPDAAEATTLPRIVADNPYAYFARVLTFLNPPLETVPGIHASAVIEASAKLAPSASIGPFAYIGKNARIGEYAVIGAGCVIGDEVSVGAHALFYPRVTVYHGCRIGDRVIFHSGAVIGADGFGIAMDEGRWLKIPQTGRVVIGNDVEIGANTTVDRGALDDTVIEDGVKLDNQIQVGHNVRIGAHTAIAGCVGIAGSAIIGRYCKIGGGAIVLGHLHIADHVDISAGTMITKSIDKAGTYTAAYPFSSHREWLRNSVHLRRLDQLAETVGRLEKRDELKRGKP